ncbi:hypothetical protein WSM22_38980 [Cytophagales bacterium WSM2-2]|nr:hypothetical protein WSM22_38980 [Cytophagales bacterium WSM2-2]
MQSTCPNCGRYHTHVLNDTWLIVCANCRHQVTNRDIRDSNAFNMPDDLSTIQIGTTGLYRGKSFTISGRIRFQLKTDFRNLWCASYDDRTIWIFQSLESIVFCDSRFAINEYQFEGLRAGAYMDFTDSIKLKCEMMEPCVDVHYEGEISRFPLPNTRLTLIQASSPSFNTALIFKNKSGELHYLWGEMMLVYGYKFENLKAWTEW